MSEHTEKTCGICGSAMRGPGREKRLLYGAWLHKWVCISNPRHVVWLAEWPDQTESRPATVPRLASLPLPSSDQAR